MAKNKTPNTEIEISEFNGNPTITIHTLDEDGKRKPYPFTVGLSKAKLIIKHIEDIEAFVEEN